MNISNVDFFAAVAMTKLFLGVLKNFSGSVINISSQGLIPIASVLAGLILQGLGSTALLVFCTVGFFITALMLLLNPRTKEI